MSGTVLVGAGSMAVAYARVLATLGVSFQCLGRGSESAQRFQSETGVMPTTGTLDDQLKVTDVTGKMAIVAVDMNQLSGVCHTLLDAGIGGVLVEKPGGLDLAEMQSLAERDVNQRIRVAYNRRFLKSTQRALEIIAADGGAQSVHFEFTEMPDRLESSGVHPPEVLANLPYANSSHVFDLAFHLVDADADLGDVTVQGAVRQGAIGWHPDGSRFASCGTVSDRALYTCFADWRSGGNWNVEVTTQHRRLRMRPLETLTEQLRETFAVIPVVVDSEPSGLKPGLTGMVAHFLNEGGAGLPSMRDQAKGLHK